MATARNYYLGIDLGTTNSVVAWGAIDAFNHRVMPEVIKVAMRGTVTGQEIVPSVVMYKEGQQDPEEVGLGPKQMLKSPQPGYTVIKSVKLQMEQSYVRGAEWLRPEQVSAHILQFLKSSVEQYLPDNPAVSDVVIGVPVCFSPDMKTKTVKAAEIAGFRKAQLVVEPLAALHDFIREQERRAPEARWIDFSEPKILVIFDLGGGTLDVSMVRAYQIPKEEHGRVVMGISYDELGLSRFKEIGGDNFDKLLADFLKDVFYEQTKICLDSTPDKSLRTLAYGILLEYAETAKKDLTFEVDRLMRNKRLSEEEAMNQAVWNVQIPYLYKTYSLTCHLTYRRYVEIIKPLLGLNWQMSDVENPTMKEIVDSAYRGEREMDIVIPIFAALLQAKDKLGSIPQIDAVLVNGGMAKSHVIRQRLRDFFKVKHVIDVPNPDLSVARGAVIHHYNVVHGLDRARHVLPEGISLEGLRGYRLLVPAGIEYPTTNPILLSGLFTIPQDRPPHLDIPLWRGEPPKPTKKLVERRIIFGDKSTILSRGDALDLRIDIDANCELKLKAWLQREPSINFDVVARI